MMTLNKNLRIKLLGALLGALLGYVYWYFVGCQDGCTIQSVWWRMSLWAAVMGYLLSSMILEYFNDKKQKK